MRGLVDDVYVQIGLVLLIGLSAKNSILIVEFAEQLIERGRSITEAAIEAAELRLRPDPDDVVCIHPGRSASLLRQRRRQAGTALGWDSDRWRHVVLHRAESDFYSGAVRNCEDAA